MIQATTETAFSLWINTEANRIDTSVASTKIKHLIKFTNDLDGGVFYSYPQHEIIYDRYTLMLFTYNVAPANVPYGGQTNLIPAGYYKYEAYEVSWIGTLGVASGTAPATEIDIFNPADDNKGVVQGLVAIGKLNLSEKSGTEQVQYVQSAKSVRKLKIETGGAGYTTAPTIIIQSNKNGQQATATCTISGGVVNTVTITNAGSGYTTNPTVTISGGGFTTAATITADINEENYIWYG